MPVCVAPTPGEQWRPELGDDAPVALTLATSFPSRRCSPPQYQLRRYFPQNPPRCLRHLRLSVLYAKPLPITHCANRVATYCTRMHNDLFTPCNPNPLSLRSLLHGRLRWQGAGRGRSHGNLCGHALEASVCAVSVAATNDDVPRPGLALAPRLRVRPVTRSLPDVVRCVQWVLEHDCHDVRAGHGFCPQITHRRLSHDSLPQHWTARGKFPQLSCVVCFDWGTICGK